MFVNRQKQHGKSRHGARGTGSGRRMRVKVKTARRRSSSSTKWLDRQLNDPYIAQAKREGYRSRAAFKLLEIDQKYRLLKKGMRVMDLGAAPGGWSQIAAEKVGSTSKYPLVIGIDYLPVEPIAGVISLQMDFLNPAAPQALLEALGDQKANLILSDMAAATTGHKQTDHIRTLHLCEEAFSFAIESLTPGGHFLAKMFQGGTENKLLTALKSHFEKVYHVKPPASRKQSPELYVLAKGLKPTR